MMLQFFLSSKIRFPVNLEGHLLIACLTYGGRVVDYIRDLTILLGELTEFRIKTFFRLKEKIVRRAHPTIHSHTAPLLPEETMRL